MQIALPQRPRRQRNKQAKMVIVPPLPPRGTRQYNAAVMRNLGYSKPRPPRRRGLGRRGRNSLAAGPDSSVGPMVGLASAYARSQRGGVSEQDWMNTGMKHELIATVAGSTGFAVTPYVINPGNSVTFPWLSRNAVNWESYRFNYLRFRYETRKGTTTDGSVIMAIDYDPTDAPPVDEAVMTSYSGAAEDATWKNNACVALPSQLHKIGPQKYVRGSNLPTGANIIDFDCGNFMFGTTAQADASNIGKLWVDYDITLFTKQTVAGLSAPANNKVAQFSEAAHVITSGVPEVSPSATADFNGIGAVNAAGAITLPAGNYMYFYDALVTAATAITSASISPRKNGVAQETGTTAIGAGATMTSCAISRSGFLQSDGNDTVDAYVAVSGTGALAYTTTFTILAV